MSFFKRNNKVNTIPADNSGLAQLVLDAIHDGVVIMDQAGVIRFINPAALRMINARSAADVIGIDYTLVIRLESKDGSQLAPENNPMIRAFQTGQAVDFRAGLIGLNTDKRIPVAISVLSAEEARGSHIMTFRNISKEVEEEGAQADFISTASHEMRTPVASIEGYLSLALNPQTATIDSRAKKYLDAAHDASKHLGNLFRDLLDVTKFDDGKIRAHMVPAELFGFVKQLSDAFAPQFQAANLKYVFGSDDNRVIKQLIYGSVDPGFTREILGNLIENAIKYTPEGGTVHVNVRGDADRAVISVKDSGIGISAEDLGHIFQKFYRADNSQTRTAGGTGLGLYLVKQRVEAMGGKVWAESQYGRGSTFFVSLPRISADEYQKRLIAYQNQQAAQAMAERSAMQNAQQNQFNNQFNNGGVNTAQ